MLVLHYLYGQYIYIYRKREGRRKEKRKNTRFKKKVNRYRYLWIAKYILIFFLLSVFCQLGMRLFQTTIGRDIIATWNTAEIEIIRRRNGRRESGARERYGKAGTVFLARRYTMTNGTTPDMTVQWLTGSPAMRGNGIIRTCMFDRITETNARKTWSSENLRNISKHIA